MTEAAGQVNNSSENGSANRSNSAPADGLPDAGVVPPSAPSYKGTKHKIDFDGHEVELDYDTLVNDFKKHAKEAYSLRQQMNPVMEFVSALKSGDLSILGQIVPEQALYDFSEKRLKEFVELQNMDPRERALREREARIEKIEREAKQREEAREKSIREAELSKVHQQVQLDLVDAVRDLVGDEGKASPRLLRRVAEKMYAALESNRTFNPKDIARREWEGLAEDYNEYQSKMLKKDAKAFISSLPPELIKAIREHEIASARPLKAAEVAPKSQEFVPEKKGLSIDDTFKALDRYYDRKRKRMNQ